jgi:hypothetical protein
MNGQGGSLCLRVKTDINNGKPFKRGIIYRPENSIIKMYMQIIIQIGELQCGEYLHLF